MNNQIFNKSKSFNIRGELFFLDSPKIMGILNVTDDSFYDGGRYVKIKDILKRVEIMLDEGADFIDIGAQSSRPGAKEIGSEQELERLIPAIKAIRKEFPQALLSVDTWHSEVARVVTDEGADIINDISGGTFDDKMFETIASLNVPYVLMHTGGRPENMQKNPSYDDVVQDVLFFLSEKIRQLHLMGLSDIIIDPGFGFGKTLEHNYELMNALEHFTFLEKALLVGISRKSMIYKALGITPDEALAGTTALNMFALQKGADILRVHDVKEAKQTIEVFRLLKN